MQPRSLIALLFATSAGILACGDNKGAPDAFNVVADGSAGADAPPAGSANPNAFVVAGDFTAGDPGVGAHVVASVPPTVSNITLPGAFGDDPVVRLFGDDLIVVNRADGNNITLLDAKTFTLIQQIATGSNSNPQDVTIADGKLYVPIYGGSGGVGVEVLSRGSAAPAFINLGSDDPDGKPNCSSAFTVGTDVYVTCQLLDDTNANLPPRGSGEVYVIDSGSDAVRTKFALQTANPVGLLEASGDGNLVTSTVDFTNNGSGCVEKITVGATPTSACLVDNTLLGGFASRVQFDTAQLMVAAVEDASFHGQLVTYDLAVTVTPVSAQSENIGDVAVCPNGTLIAADVTTGSAGIRLFSINEELTTGPTAVGLPPDAAHGLVCY
jgi:hypothetical protein